MDIAHQSIGAKYLVAGALQRAGWTRRSTGKDLRSELKAPPNQSIGSFITLIWGGYVLSWASIVVGSNSFVVAGMHFHGPRHMAGTRASTPVGAEYPIPPH